MKLTRLQLQIQQYADHTMDTGSIVIWEKQYTNSSRFTREKGDYMILVDRDHKYESVFLTPKTRGTSQFQKIVWDSLKSLGKPMDYNRLCFLYVQKVLHVDRSKKMVKMWSEICEEFVNKPDLYLQSVLERPISFQKSIKKFLVSLLGK